MREMIWKSLLMNTSNCLCGCISRCLHCVSHKVVSHPFFTLMEMTSLCNLMYIIIFIYFLNLRPQMQYFPYLSPCMYVWHDPRYTVYEQCRTASAPPKAVQPYTTPLPKPNSVLTGINNHAQLKDRRHRSEYPGSPWRAKGTISPRGFKNVPSPRYTLP